MATTLWWPNAQAISQVDSITVTAVANGGTLSAVINGKSLVYTCTASDTTATAATNWLKVLQATQGRPAEFGEMSYAAGAAGIIICTGQANGMPVTLTLSTAGGATATLTHTTVASSPNDASLAANWLRSGSPALPQTGDTIIFADSTVPLLWNLHALSAIQPTSVQRWQSYEGSIGLPEVNPAGYQEYRPTYLQFGGGSNAVSVYLGLGSNGAGPSRERYDFQGQAVTGTLLASGSASDDYAVRFLGTNAANAWTVNNTSLGVAMLPGEVSTLASATVDGGGSIALGASVTFSGTLSLQGATAQVKCAPAAIVASGSQVVVDAIGLTFASILATAGTTITWNASGTITLLTLQTSSTLDMTGGLATTITNATIDGDTCRILDPNNQATYTNAVVVEGAVTSGPFTFGIGPAGAGRTVKIT